MTGKKSVKQKSGVVAEVVVDAPRTFTATEQPLDLVTITQQIVDDANSMKTSEASPAPKPENADHLMELSATAAKKRAERLPADPRVTVAPPEADAALVAAGFTFARTEQNASGYVHEDGRTVLAESSGQWTLLVNGLESGGANLTTLLTELAKPVPKRATKKALRINKAHTRGAHAAAAIKAGKTALAVSLTPARALEVIHEAEAIAAAKRAAKVATAVPGMPPNVVRAVEMLGSLTDGKFNLHDLRGDKHYGHRLALLKRLFDREHVVMAETGINNLMQAFYSAIGAAGNCRAAQDADFTARCQDLLVKVHDAKLAAGKEAKRTVRAVRNAMKSSLIVPGIVIPQQKPLSKAAKKVAAKKEAVALQMELAVARPTAQPRPGTKNLGRLEAHSLRLLTHANGLVSLKLERWNSQGAVHIWEGDDGRVVSGVLTPALAVDVKVQAYNLDAVKELASAWLDDKKVKKTAEMEYVLHCVVHAVNRAQSAFALSVLPYQLPAPRPSAAELTITPAGVRLLEDSILGAVLVQLERANSQGALVCYNNGMQVGVGVCPPEILETLRQMPTEVNLVTAVKQLLNPAVPSVPVTPTAAKHLTAVMHCKENIMKNTAEAPAVEKKFAAKTTPTKKAVVKPAKKAAEKKAPTERKSSLFRLLNESKAVWSAFKTQKAEIVAAFIKLGAVGKKAPGVTRAALIAALPKIGDKNISFYLSVWQKNEPVIVEKLAAAE